MPVFAFGNQQVCHFQGGLDPTPTRGQKYFNVVLVLSCRTSDLQFSLVLQTHDMSYKSVHNKEPKGVVCYMTSSSNSSQSTRPTGRVLWEELLVLSRLRL